MSYATLITLLSVLVPILGGIVGLILHNAQDTRNRLDALSKDMDAKFDKARAERESGFKDAAEAREKIRAEMRDGFKDAKDERGEIRAEMLAGLANQNATFNRVFDRINAVREDIPADISIRFEGVQHDFRVVRQDLSSTNGSLANTNGRVDKLSQALLSKGIISHPV